MFSVNNDFVNQPSDAISVGRRVGFMQSMATAYDAGVYETTNKATEIEEMFFQQNNKLREMGEENLPQVNFFGPQGGVNVRDLEAVYSGNDPSLPDTGRVRHRLS
jgi:hypothetical protein